jgi:hypothetical protein
MSLLNRATFAVLLPTAASVVLATHAGAQRGKTATPVPAGPKVVIVPPTIVPSLTGTTPTTGTPGIGIVSTVPGSSPRPADQRPAEVQGSPPYRSVVAVPVVCLAGTSSERITTVCEVIDAATFINDMRNAPDYSSAARRTLEQLRDAAQNRLIVTIAGNGVVERVKVVRAMYAAQVRFFTYVTAMIQAEMGTDPLRIASATVEARRHAQIVEQLRADIAAETTANVQAGASLLTSHPESSYVPFRCTLACRQLTGVAAGLNLFDSR